jgi:hypothetical protein
LIERSNRYIESINETFNPPATHVIRGRTWALRVTAALAALALLASGCSGIRFAYSFADNYFVGAVQDYFDPSPEQLRAVRAKAEELLVWHRQHELPLYVRMFSQAAQKVGDALTEEEILWGIGQVRARYDALAQRIIEVNAASLAALSAHNLDALEKRFAAEDAKIEQSRAKADPREREQRRVDRAQAQLERWVGPLSAEQKATVATWVAAAPTASTDWYRERVDRQRALLALLRGEHDPALLPPKLTALWLGREPYTRPRDASDSRIVALLLSIDRTLSADQRTRAVEHMQGYAEEFRRLGH